MGVRVGGGSLSDLLREEFSDTLGSATSRAAIVICYEDDGEVRTEIGFPYNLVIEEDGAKAFLEMGPYQKQMADLPPVDYEESKRRIDTSEILDWRRLEVPSEYWGKLDERVERLA